MSLDDYPKRGEVWWVTFDPSIGEEVKKTRPAVIISNNASNKALNRVQVIPLTSNVSKLYPAEAYISIEGKQSKAMGDQLTTASKKRLKQKIGELSSSDIQAVERAIKIQLGL